VVLIKDVSCRYGMCLGCRTRNWYVRTGLLGSLVNQWVQGGVFNFIHYIFFSGFRIGHEDGVTSKNRSIWDCKWCFRDRHFTSLRRFLAITQDSGFKASSFKEHQHG